MKRIIVLPQAEQDLKESAEFYKEVSVDLLNKFILAVDSSFIDIRRNPQAFPKTLKKIRKYVVSDFPFCIFYVDEADVIYILAVFHCKRNPEIWRKRNLSSGSR